VSAVAASATCALPAALDAMAENTTSSLFFRRGGARERVSHAQCRAEAEQLAEALRGLGVGPGGRVAIHGGTSYEWVLADLACLATGALSVALYASAPPGRAVAAAAESRCRVVLTDRGDAVELFRAAGLEVVFLGPAGAAPVGVTSVGDIVSAAASFARPAPAAQPRHGPFTVVSTSGTLSEPQLFAVHSAPLLFTMDRFAEIYGFDGSDRLLLYLPLSHLPQRMMLYWGLGAGLDFVLSDPAHFAVDGAKLRPSLHVTVPRVLEHLRWRVTTALHRAGTESAEARAAAYRTAFGGAITSIFVGSAPTDPALLAELLAAGLPVNEVYGTTELGMIGLNTPAGRRPGTVGRSIPWGEVRLAPETSEIEVRTPTPFLHGRLVDGEVEVQQWDPTAFEPTSDVGELDADGFLLVRGRLRDFLVLPSGEKVFLRPIEDSLGVAAGAGLCQVTTLPDGTFAALLFFEGPVPAEADLVAALRAGNAALHPWERIRSFATVDRLPSVEEGCLTETTKPRRHVIDEMHGRGARWQRLGNDSRRKDVPG